VEEPIEMSGHSGIVVPLSDLTNRELVKRLYQRYYIEGIGSAGQGSQLLSSHWKDRSSKFDVLMEDDAALSLISVGMGLTMSTSPLQNFLGYVCALSYLAKLPQRMAIASLIPRSYRVVNAMGGTFSFNCFKDVCALEMILRHINLTGAGDRLNFLMIGDGYGFFSSLIKAIFPNSTLALVDIGKTLLFQAVYCQRVHPRHVHRGVWEEAVGTDDVDFVYCPTEELDKVAMTFDVVTNVGSMQEMNYATIERYFSFLRRRCKPGNLFYCCNRELKRLIGGEVIEFKKYPWWPADRHLVDEVCPWYQYQLLTRRSAKLLGLPIPRVKYYQPILHRLTVLATEGVAQ
jgi:SAM-dependent methyltransferase